MKTMLKEVLKSELPREKLIQFGPEILSDSELFAVMLGTGTKDENVFSMSSRILEEIKIHNLPRKNYSNLIKINGINKAKACLLIASFELSKRALLDESEKKKISCAKDVFEMIKHDFMRWREERCIVLVLNRRNEVISEKTISIGTLDSNVIHPREIFRIVIEENGASLILVHNHPSGNPEPSDEDIKITKQVKAASKMMGIDFLDHVIIGNKYFSMREENIIQ